MAPIKSFAGKFARTAFVAVSSTRENGGGIDGSNNDDILRRTATGTAGTMGSTAAVLNHVHLTSTTSTASSKSWPVFGCASSTDCDAIASSQQGVTGITTTTRTSSSSPSGEISSLCLSKMCELFGARPANNLQLSSDPETGGERGVRLTGDGPTVKAGDVVLSVPLSSCFRDDEPPAWYTEGSCSSNDNDTDERRQHSDDGDTHCNAEDTVDVVTQDYTEYERYNPSAWASRLAASIVDMNLEFQLDRLAMGTAVGDTDAGGDESYRGMSNNDDDDDEHASRLNEGRAIWKSLLPDKDLLRASLPVHWNEDVLSASKCTALEMAVDAAYFARASAVTALSESVAERTKRVAREEGGGQGDPDALEIAALDMESLQQMCHDALDIVQTRACRVERRCEDGVQWGPPLRIVAPVFDFINHATATTANAKFGLENSGAAMFDMEGARLVVRATRDIRPGEEVLIDYGDSARPAWRCLTSYGFVPEYDDDADATTTEEDDELDSEGGEGTTTTVSENVAELWMNGMRFEVDATSVPFELVEVAASQVMLDGGGGGGLARQEGRSANAVDDDDDDDDDDAGYGMLTPRVARLISNRAKDAAFNLITEPEAHDDALAEEDWDDPEYVHSSSLAALLRWSQHRVLLAFADNLDSFSRRERATSSSSSSGSGPDDEEGVE